MVVTKMSKIVCCSPCRLAILSNRKLPFVPVPGWKYASTYKHRSKRVIQRQSYVQPPPQVKPQIQNIIPSYDDDDFYRHVDSKLIKQDLLVNINKKIEDAETGRLFAIVQIASKQRKITAEDVIIIEGGFIPNIGDQIRLEKVLLVGSKDFTLIGRPMLNPNLVHIEATVIEKTLSHNKVRLHYTPKKRDSRFTLMQVFYTMLQINSINLTKYDVSKQSITYT